MTFKTREYESCDIRLTLKYELTKTFMTFCIFYHLMFKRRDAIAKKPFSIHLSKKLTSFTPSMDHLFVLLVPIV